MYTGIVQGVEAVINMQERAGYRSITVSNALHLLDDVAAGASVAIDGVCLTVTAHDGQGVSFDVSNFTLASTTLKHLKLAGIVNVERSQKSGQENGGHSLYGHIEGVARVVGWGCDEQGVALRIHIPDGKIKYFFHKGFIGLHGCSLTINHVDQAASVLTLNLIPETLRITNLHAIQVNDALNFEIDQTTRVLVDTLSRLMIVPLCNASDSHLIHI